MKNVQRDRIKGIAGVPEKTLNIKIFFSIKTNTKKPFGTHSCGKSDPASSRQAQEIKGATGLE